MRYKECLQKKSVTGRQTFWTVTTKNLFLLPLICKQNNLKVVLIKRIFKYKLLTVEISYFLFLFFYLFELFIYLFNDCGSINNLNTINLPILH